MALGSDRSLSLCCIVLTRLVATQKTLESGAPHYGAPFGAPRGCFVAWTGHSMETLSLGCNQTAMGTVHDVISFGRGILQCSRMLINVANRIIISQGILNYCKRLREE